MTPLLLAYDHECPRCRKWMAWVGARDREGLLVPFPLQSPELIRVAPELAGKPLDQAIHGVDAGTREVWAGAALLPQVLRRLPRWRILAPLFALPGVSGMAAAVYRWVAARRQTRMGRGLRRS